MMTGVPRVFVAERGRRAVPVDTARDRDAAGTVPAEGDRHCPIDAHRLSRRIRAVGAILFVSRQKRSVRRCARAGADGAGIP